MEKIVIHDRVYVNHPELGWLIMGPYGWQGCFRPYSIRELK